MELAYIGIAVAVYGLILFFLFILKRKGKQTSKPSKITTIAMSLVIAGLIFGNGVSWFGYFLLGAGLILSLVDLIINLKKQ